MISFSSRILVSLSVFIPLGAAWSTSTNTSSNPKQYELCAQRFVKIGFSDGELDDVLQRATALLDAASAASSSCANIVLKRRNSVTSFDDASLPRAVGVSTDFEKLIATSCVKIVQRITWCGSPIIDGGALGCSSIPGSAMVVVRTYDGLPQTFNTGVEPVTWLHEFGHNLGLEHNSVDDLDLMAPGISPETVHISDEECTKFSGSQAFAANGNTNAGAIPLQSVPRVMPAEPNGSQQTTQTVPLEEFVKRPLKGAQLVAAASYGGEVNKAEGLLFDPSFTNFKNNIVGLLAVIGTPDTIPVLEKLIRTPLSGGANSPDVLAHFAALTTIGAIANRYKLPDDKVNILKRASNPQFWDDYVLLSDNLDAGDAKSLVRDLSIQSVNGYAMTGTMAAKEFLTKAKSDVNGAAVPEPIRRERTEILNQAIKLNETSATQGALGAFHN